MSWWNESNFVVALYRVWQVLLRLGGQVWRFMDEQVGITVMNLMYEASPDAASAFSFLIDFFPDSFMRLTWLELILGASFVSFCCYTLAK